MTMRGWLVFGWMVMGTDAAPFDRATLVARAQQ
jgi:hypothetical protein